MKASDPNADFAEPMQPWLRPLLTAAVTLVLAVCVLGLVLVRRGTAAMDRSDRAFHAGDLRAAVWEAKAAGLSYVPGSSHVERAAARLEAIARGAAAEDRLDLARLAWDALRLIDEQTGYPGRGATAFGLRARAELERASPARGAPR